MRARAAVLREMGRPAPYARSRPLELAERISGVTTLAATSDVVDQIRAATDGGAPTA